MWGYGQRGVAAAAAAPQGGQAGPPAPGYSTSSAGAAQDVFLVRPLAGVIVGVRREAAPPQAQKKRGSPVPHLGPQKYHSAGLPSEKEPGLPQHSATVSGQRFPGLTTLGCSGEVLLLSPLAVVPVCQWRSPVGSHSAGDECISAARTVSQGSSPEGDRSLEFSRTRPIPAKRCAAVVLLR